VKNILLVIETRGPGGAEQMLVHLAEHLDSSRYHKRVVLLRPGWIQEQLQDRGIEAVLIPSERSWDFTFLRRLMREIRGFNTDLIHSHLPGANLYASVAGWLTGRPTVLTYHGELFLPGPPTRYAAIKNMLVRRFASRIVMVADYLKEDFVKRAKFPAAKLTTIYNGIPMLNEIADFDTTVKRATLGVQPDDPVVGIVANFRPAKGYEYFIEAAHLVRQRLPNTKFLVVGQGREAIEKKVHALIDRFKLHDNIVLLGFRQDVPELLRVFDVFVLSSISEGLPLSVVEAMAAHKPVVVTRVGGLAELVAEGDSGFLVPPRNAELLAERILEILTNPQLRDKMGRRGRKIVETKFTVTAMVDQYQSLYEELLN
jgi:glycosyltransferase involved in cell wall biosynthesis